MAKNKKQNSGKGGIKKSTAVIFSIMTFAFGLYCGYLLAGMNETQSAPAKTSIRSANLPAPNAPGQSAQPEQNGMVSDEHQAQLESLRKAVAEAPNSAAAWNKLGHWYFDHQMPKEAITAYEKSLKIVPDDPDILTDLGVMYRADHQHEKALELFRKANSINPSHEVSLFNSGIALMDLKRDDEAIAVWKSLRSRNPNFVTPSGMSIGELLKKLGADSR
ncbi:tetratricopeptide repeat protein [Desulfovibrio sp. OttesenSCG-928-C06]|nr:tetratricopeptide repeat protein [Desulfovibrio sp. OttesenSCG-928-C06]